VGVAVATPERRLVQSRSTRPTAALRLAGGSKMAKKKKSASVPIKDCMFFPEDFRRLHRNYVIYIKQEVIIDLDKL
jgi:hypothetical protein